MTTPRLSPGTSTALAAELAAARDDGQRVHVYGRGTRGRAGDAPHADLELTTHLLDRVVAYEPGDLTITVEAGMAVADLDARLARESQCLPIQGRSGPGTVGGLVATAAPGACDLLYGAPRDRLIGAAVALGDGTIARGRGRVVKNAAGYDIPRLLAGSHGTLGVIVEASFRLQPRPAVTGSLVLRYAAVSSAFEAARQVLEQPFEPAFVNVLWNEVGDEAPRSDAPGRDDGVDVPSISLAIGFDGSETRVHGLLERTAALLGDATDTTVMGPAEDTRLRRHLDEPTGDAVVRMTTPHSLMRAQTVVTARAARAEGVAVAVDARPGLHQVHLAYTSDDPEQVLRALRASLPAARRDGTHATVTRAPSIPAATGQQGTLPTALARLSARDIWGPTAPDAVLMQRVKGALDPDGVFATGGWMHAS